MSGRVGSAARLVADEVRTLGRELWSEGRGWILLAVAAGWMLSIGVRYVFPAMFPFLRSEFDLTLSTVGLSMSLLWGAYAVGHIPGGYVSDTFGERRILSVSTAFSAVALLLVVFSVDVPTLFAGLVLFGLTTAMFGPTRLTILTDVYPEKSGSAIGLTMAAGSVGNALFPVVAVAVATATIWQYGFGVFVLLFLAVAVGIRALVPTHTSEQSNPVRSFSLGDSVEFARELFRTSIPVVVLSQITISVMNQGFTSFYPTYLTVAKDLGPNVAATLFGLFFVTGAVSQPLAGHLMDRFGIRLSLLSLMGCCVAAFWVLPFVTGLLPLGVLTALLGSLNGCSVVTQTHITGSLPDEARGTSLGLLKFVWMSIGASSPFLIGVFADAQLFDEGFLFLAGVGTLGLIVVARQVS